MNSKHERFAAGLAAGLNGKDAAIAAGFSPRSAKVTASRLRRDPCIEFEVDRIKRGDSLPLHRRGGLDLTPFEFLLSVINDPGESVRRRIRAATAVLPYQRRPL